MIKKDLFCSELLVCYIRKKLMKDNEII